MKCTIASSWSRKPHHGKRWLKSPMDRGQDNTRVSKRLDRWRVPSALPPREQVSPARMLKFSVTAEPIRLLALDIDGTLLNPQFEISPVDMAALRRANETGIEVVLVTGRRHDFALPIAQQLGF